jgi:F-box domain
LKADSFRAFHSIKRQKMNDTVNSSLNKSEYDEQRDTSVSVTVYEDECDLSYFNKSSINRVMSTSMNKRSPLATINKPSGSSSGHKQQQQVVKVHRKIDERLQPKENQSDPFQFLSEEMLVHLFSFLPKKTLNRIAVVNERFSRIVQDKTLWIRLDLGGKYVRPGALGIIIARELIIIRLAQTRLPPPIFDKDFFSENYQSKLQYLDLSMASIDKPSLTELLAVCRSLKKLSLEAVPIDINVCRQIAMNKSLEVLNLAMCEGLKPDGVMVIITNLQNLLALNISWTQLSSNCVAIIMENLTPAIMRLNIAGCRKSLMDKREYYLEKFL